MAGLTTASLPRTVTVGSRTVNTTSLVADILAQLEQPINTAVEAALTSPSSSSETSETSTAVVSQVVGQVSPGAEEAVVGVVTSHHQSQQDLLVEQVNSAISQIIASQVQSSLFTSSNSSSSTSSSPAGLAEEVVTAIRPAVVAAAADQIRSHTESLSDLSATLQPRIRAAVVEILRTRAEQSFASRYQPETLRSEVLAVIELRINRLLSQSLEDSQIEPGPLSSEVLEAITPAVSTAVSTQLSSLKKAALSQAVSESQVSRYVSEVSEALQARMEVAVAGAVRTEAETISDLVLSGLKPNIVKLISAAISSEGQF